MEIKAIAPTAYARESSTSEQQLCLVAIINHSDSSNHACLEIQASAPNACTRRLSTCATLYSMPAAATR
eukprot:6429397-Amphidinium_carterae.1